MKIIRFVDGWDEGRFDVCFHPDSALLLPGRPLFYPDFAGEWVARLYAAVHVNRLGKNVSVKFAPRYYDGVALSIRVMPGDDSMLAPGVLSGLDNSITHGEWLTPDECAALTTVMIGDVSVRIPMPDADVVNRSVSQASKHTTLRMGDLIMIPLGIAPVGISPRSRFIVTQADRELMNVKIV